MPTVTYLRPEDYGADPTTAVNSGPALQSAFNAAATQKAEVWLSGGTYLTAQALTVPDGVRVVGENPGTTVIAGMLVSSQFTGDRLLDVGNGVWLEGFTVDGAAAAAKLLFGVHAQNVSGVTVRSCVVKRAQKQFGAQVWLLGCTSSVVEDCEVSDGERGVAVKGACADVRVSGCRAHTLSKFGILVESVETGVSVRTTVEGCQVWNIVDNSSDTPKAKHPIYFGTTTSGSPPAADRYHEDARIVGNRVYGNHQASYFGAGTADNIAVYQCRGAVVANNHSFFGGDLGISVDYSEHCVVVGNVCGVNDTDGIGIYRSSDCVVSANVSYNNGRDWDGVYRNATPPRLDMAGILVTESHDTVVTGNRCWEDGSDAPPTSAGKQRYGVTVTASSTGTLVSDNHLQGNDAGALSTAAGQWIGSQYDGTGFRFDAGIRLGTDVLISRLGVGVTRVSGYLCAGDAAAGWGGSLNAKANSDLSLGAVIRGFSATQSADLLSVESHDGAQQYLRVSPGKLGFFGTAPVVQPSVSTGTADVKVDSVIAALRALGLIAP